MPKVLVLGAGVPGEAAALHLARAGRQVDVAEIVTCHARTRSVGGALTHLIAR